MASRYDFFDTVWNDDFQSNQKGVLDINFINKLKEADYILYKIPLKYKYRPDLIAYNFYGNNKYYWILTYINDINDSPQGFYTNRIIKVPSSAIIGTLI
jgi:hypothetical protein